jgi:hypothetical protein
MQNVLFDPDLTLSLVCQRRAELMAEARQAQLVDTLSDMTNRAPLRVRVTVRDRFLRVSRLLVGTLRSVSLSPSRF